MKTTAFLSLLVCILFRPSAAMSQFSGSEDFSATSRNYSIWSGGLTNGVGAIRQTNGHSVYSLLGAPSGVSPNESEVWYWSAPATSTQSWSIQIEVTLPAISFSSGQQAGFGLLVLPEGSEADFRANYLSFQLRVSSPTPGRHFLMRTVTNAVSRDVSLATAVTNTTLKVSWDAATQVLQGFYFDGSTWVALDSNPIVNPFSMGSTNRFRVGFFGQSQSLSVGEADGIFGDNFLATMLSPPVSPVAIWTAVEITFPTQTNRLYQIQWASVVNSNVWFNFGGSFRGTGSTNSTFDTTRGQQQKYYRVLGYD